MEGHDSDANAKSGSPDLKLVSLYVVVAVSVTLITVHCVLLLCAFNVQTVSGYNVMQNKFICCKTFVVISSFFPCEGEEGGGNTLDT